MLTQAARPSRVISRVVANVTYFSLLLTISPHPCERLDDCLNLTHLLN